MELGAVARALCLLETLSKTRSSNLETLSKETGLPKATALRLLSSLVEQGYVTRDDSDRYSLTLRMFTVGSRALKYVDLLETANPVARALRDGTGETVHIGILEEDRAVYVLKCESLYTIRMNSRVGKSIPLYSSAIGKCLLADFDEKKLESYLESADLKRYTPKTICTKAKLRKEILSVKEKGYAFDDEENESGVFCIGAPIRNAYGEVVAAMSLSTPVFRLEKENIGALVDKVRKACDGISAVLGYLGGSET
jgi:IclR family KDG regulon transcriptional repressor